jgi:hypothetical protein
MRWRFLVDIRTSSLEVTETVRRKAMGQAVLRSR